MKSSSFIKRLSILVTAIATLAFAPLTMAQKHIKQNLGQLVSGSTEIISGKVISVTDGFDTRRRPYTEITIKVGQDVKGIHKEGTEYTFRQFGLLKPRSMGNGMVYLGVSPEGFARWNVGEQIIAFMNPDTGAGLRSTVGLEQGKFIIQNNMVVNSLHNVGLFEKMDTSGFTSEEMNMITTPGAVDAAAFMGLVGKLAGVQ